MAEELAGRVQTITQSLQRLEQTLAHELTHKTNRGERTTSKVSNFNEGQLMTKLAQADASILRLKRHKNMLIQENETLRRKLGENTRPPSPIDISSSMMKSQTSSRLGRSSSSYAKHRENSELVSYWKDKALEFEGKLKAIINEFEGKESFWTQRIKMLGQELDVLAVENARLKTSDRKSDSTTSPSQDDDVLKELKSMVKAGSYSEIPKKVSELFQKLRHCRHFKHRLADLVKTDSTSSKDLFACLKQHVQASLELTDQLKTPDIVQRVSQMILDQKRILGVVNLVLTKLDLPQDATMAELEELLTAKTKL
jgi:hypothetical protein